MARTLSLTIHSLIYPLHLFIDHLEVLESKIVHGSILDLGLIRPSELDQLWNIGKLNLAQAYCRDPCRAARIGVDRVSDLFDFHIHHIRKYLTP